MKYQQADIVEINFMLPELKDEMINFKLSKKSYVKCQIITSDKERGIIKKVGKMIEPYFSQMIDKIIYSIF